MPDQSPAQPLRLTRQRQAVADALEHDDQFRSAREIHAVLRDRGNTIGLATVYRTLQGMASDPGGRLWFTGLFLGLYRTDARLRERARREVEIPPEVTAATGFNHIGDPAWDAREGGRVLLPLECYSPGAPGGANTCQRGGIGVAAPYREFLAPFIDAFYR